MSLDGPLIVMSFPIKGFFEMASKETTIMGNVLLNVVLVGRWPSASRLSVYLADLIFRFPVICLVVVMGV